MSKPSTDEFVSRPTTVAAIVALRDRIDQAVKPLRPSIQDMLAVLAMMLQDTMRLAPHREDALQMIDELRMILRHNVEKHFKDKEAERRHAN